MFSVQYAKFLFALFLAVSFLGNIPKSFGQKSELSSDFHKNRRVELRQKLPNNSVAVFFSSPVRNRANDVDYVYHPDPNFFYLTGWNEPHAVLMVFNVPQEDEEGIYYEKLYVRERNARNEMWNFLFFCSSDFLIEPIAFGIKVFRIINSIFKMFLEIVKVAWIIFIVTYIIL